MIRKFKADDINDVMKIWLESNIQVHNFIPADYWEINYENVKALLPKAVVYVYERDGRVIGFIGLEDKYVAGIFVMNNERSNGIGKLLLDNVKKNHNSLVLNVYKKNERAVQFYKREGFLIAAEERDDNTKEEEYHMKWSK